MTPRFQVLTLLAVAGLLVGLPRPAQGQDGRGIIAGTVVDEMSVTVVAGADVILTYYARQAARWLKET